MKRIFGLGAIFLAVACSGDAASDATAPPPIRSTGTSAEPRSSSTSASNTTSSVPATSGPTRSTMESTGIATTTTDAVDPGTTPPEPGLLVDVPGDGAAALPAAAAAIDVPGEVYELIPGLFLFVPTADSATDPNVEPPLPEHRLIIEAYARAMAADYALITQNPIPGLSPEVDWNPSRTDNWDVEYASVVEPSLQAGLHLDLRDGDLLRPIVLADPSTETVAFIADCSLVLSDWVSNTTGDTAPGEPAGLEVVPWIVEMRLADGEWQLYRRSGDPRGCA